MSGWLFHLFSPRFPGLHRGRTGISQPVSPITAHGDYCCLSWRAWVRNEKKLSFVWQEFQREKRMRLYQQVPLKVAHTRSRWASIYYFHCMGEKHIFIFLFWCMLCKYLSWIKISALCTHRILTGLPWQIKFCLLTVRLASLGIVSLQGQQNGQNSRCADASADAVHSLVVAFNTPDMDWSTWCMGTHPCNWRGWLALKLLQLGLWESICQSGYCRSWLSSQAGHQPNSRGKTSVSKGNLEHWNQ